MAQVDEKAIKKPRSVRVFVLPEDPQSLEQTTRHIHEHLVKRSRQLKKSHHDLKTRQAFQYLFKERAAAWQKLFLLDKSRAITLSGELNLRLPRSLSLREGDNS